MLLMMIDIFGDDSIDDIEVLDTTSGSTDGLANHRWLR